MTIDQNQFLADLFSRNPYAMDDLEKLPLLQKALTKELQHHLRASPMFRRFYEERNSETARSSELVDLPFLPVHVFKELGAQLRSVDESDITLTLQSSATSGRPSTVSIDRITSRRQTKALSLVLGDMLGQKRRPFLFLDVNPQSHPAHLGARSAAILGFLKHSSDAGYFLTPESGGLLQFDKDSFAAAVSRLSPLLAPNQTPPVIFGFTSILFEHVIEPSYRKGDQFALPPGSALVHIGGWKRLKDMQVDKSKFDEMASHVFGINPSNIIDNYGFTEQMGMNYPDCSSKIKHAPAFGEVIVRDPITWEQVPDGLEGVLQFISPLPHSYPGVSLLTDDLGIIVSHQNCQCGRNGTGFIVTGRLADAEIRGCGDVMSESFVAPRGSPITRIGPATQDQVEVLLHNGTEQPPVMDLTGVVDDLKIQQQWLSSVPFEAMVALIGQVSKKWQESEEYTEYRKGGLDFLARWCSPANLRDIADRSLQGTRAHLDGFLPSNGSLSRSMMAVPRGLSVHWISGNVPYIGMFTLVQSILAKNVNLVKVPATGKALLPSLLQAFSDTDVVGASGYELKGKDLLNTISVVYFERNHPAGEQMSVNADVRIAWGGQEAIEAIASYPKQYQAEDILFGPKLSFMAIGREFLFEGPELKRLVRHAATDSSVFDQYGCASPHTIFVEEGGDISPKEFAEHLSVEMEKALHRIPKADVDAGTALEVRLSRIKYLMLYDVWRSPGLGWTVLYDEEDLLAAPTYSRVVTVRPVKDLLQTIKHVTKGTQTVGLALNGPRRLEYAREAALRGAERFPDVGKMSLFDIPWDGVFPLHRMVRWVSLGGP